MLIKNVNVMVTNNIEKKMTDGTIYRSVGVLSLDGDGAKFDISVRDMELAEKLRLFEKYNLDFDLQSSKYGLKLVIHNVNNLPKQG